MDKNYVLHAKSNEFYWEGYGQLSIKTFANGEAHYRTSKGFFKVEENRYLLLNEGSYTISIEEDKEVESFCVFFKEEFADAVLHSLKESTDTLLTDPCYTKNALNFFEKTYHNNPTLTSQLNVLKNGLQLYKQDSLWQDEQYQRIMQTLIFLHRDNLKEVESLTSIKSSTREELYRRLSIAHDYIRAYYNQPIELKDIARVACLSENHLIRNYSKLYGKTPHQQISHLRILKAKEFLANLDYSMTEITFQLGFLNPTSFSKMFKQNVGLSPLQYRKKVILEKK